MELAEKLLGRDVQSWGALSETEISRLADALVGFELVASLVMQR